MRLRSTTPRVPTVLSRADTTALWLFTALTALIGVAILAFAVPAIAEVFRDEVSISLSASAPIPDDAAAGTARIVSGSFDTASLLVAGIDTWPRVALAVSIGLSSLCAAAVAATIVALCLGILSGRPFVRSVIGVLTTASLVLIAGSLLGAFLNTMAVFSIVEALAPDPEDPVFPFQSEYDLTPLVIGLVFGAVATAFQLGQRMQRDTEGLV